MKILISKIKTENHIEKEKYKTTPLINSSFGNSFGNVEGEESGPCKCVRCPLYRYLQGDPDIQVRMPPADKNMEEELGVISQVTA